MNHTPEYHRAWYHDRQRESYKMWNRRKIQAKKHGYDFNITEADIVSAWPADGMCPILRVPMVKLGPYAPSLDRIRSDEGYISGNICVISRRANRIKNDGTAAEHRSIAEYLDGHLRPVS